MGSNPKHHFTCKARKMHLLLAACDKRNWSKWPKDIESCFFWLCFIILHVSNDSIWKVIFYYFNICSAEVCFQTKLKQENIIKNTMNFKDRAANIYHKG